MGWGTGIAEGAASSAIDAGMGLVLGGINDRRQSKQQERLQDIQIKGQKQMTDYNAMKQLEMWKATSYPAQIEMMKKAGINPGLMYQQGGMGGSTALSTGTVAGATAPTGGHELQDVKGMGMQIQMMAAQKDVLEAQARNLNVDADKKEGVDTENVKADTAVKIAEQVIKEYTGKDAKLTFERIKKPNIAVEGETNLKELEARQGIASNLYDLWQQGKLQEKSLGEVESILLSNSKTREETRNIQKQFDLLEENLKGVKLDNIIKELESRLQTQTGIDKNSPVWLKILGRLFVELTK